jgi:excinuclease UvrABC nuclease subunit
MVYPAGQHLALDVVDNVREKVRRAAISMEWIKRSESDLAISLPGAKGIGVPLR